MFFKTILFYLFIKINLLLCTNSSLTSSYSIVGDDDIIIDSSDSTLLPDFEEQFNLCDFCDCYEDIHRDNLYLDCSNRSLDLAAGWRDDLQPSDVHTFRAQNV